MKLKKSVDPQQIIQKEHQLLLKCKEKLSKNENFILLGNGFQDPHRHLPVLSFMIKSLPNSDLFLHHNFVCALLNDLFGIQARGGCACSGPYAQHLMGMDQKLSKEYENLLLEDNRLDRTHLRRGIINKYTHIIGKIFKMYLDFTNFFSFKIFQGHQECSQHEFLRPGFSRLNLPWFATTEEIDYILEALEFVSNHGWKFMPQYIFNHETGEWKHHTNQVFKERKWLGNFNFKNGEMSWSNQRKTDDITNNDEKEKKTLEYFITKAHELLAETTKAALKMPIPDQSLLFQDPKAAKLRWILLPSDVKSILCSRQGILPNNSQNKAPFHPISYPKIQNATESTVVGSYQGRILEPFNVLSNLNNTGQSLGNTKSSWLDIKIDSTTNSVISKNDDDENEVKFEEPSIDACILTKRSENPPALKVKFC